MLKTDTLWLVAFLLGFLFSFGVFNSTPGLGLFLGVNTLVLALWYFGHKNVVAKELQTSKESEWLLRILTGVYVLLTLPYLYRLDYAVIAVLVGYHVVFLLLGAMYFALPSALHITDIFTLILSPIVLGLTWLIESVKAFFELFKENANTVKLLLKIVLYVAASLLVFILFAKLLSAADAEFKLRIDKVLEALDLVEVMRRLVVGVVMAFVSAGLLTVIGLSKVLPLFGLSTERAKQNFEKAFSLVLSKRSDALLPVIITTPVLFLFALYVWVQFSYLFGQDVSAILTKYSFADYARRGFVELLVVGILTYPLLSWSMNQSKSEWKVPRIAAFFINTGIVSTLVIMLYSLILRMNLYMNTYGPSVLRTYVIVGAVFVGIALVAYELLAIAKAIKPGFALFKGRLMTDYVIVAILTSLGLLGAISLIPWNSLVGSRIVSYYENTRKLDVFQVTSLPLESEGLVYQFGKTLEADGLKEAGLLLQAHAVQEVSQYKKSREESIFSQFFGMNISGSILFKNVMTNNQEDVIKHFTTTMNERISFIADGYINALQAGDFATARSFYDQEMKSNDISGFAPGVYVLRKKDAYALQEKMMRESTYVKSFVSGMSTTSAYDVLYLKRLNENSVETSVQSTIGFRNGKVVILDSTFILAYLPDAISENGDRYGISAYGYKTYCKIPNLEVLYSEYLGCDYGATQSQYMPENFTEKFRMPPMGEFKESDFTTQRQE